MADTVLTPKQAARILNVVGRVDAAAPKIKTVFMQVVGTDLKSSGLSIDDVRTAMQTASDMGIEADDAPAAPAKDVGKTSGGKKGASPPKTASKATKQAATKKDPVEPVEISDIEAKKILKAMQAENPDRWGKVERIVSFTAKGRPERVVIRCESLDNPGTYTKERREIAVQDLFQVRYSVEDTKKARSRARTLRRQARNGKPEAKTTKKASGGRKTAKAGK